MTVNALFRHSRLIENATGAVMTSGNIDSLIEQTEN